MAVKEIGTRFKLEGVQKFKQEMNNCAAAVKVLNSEEKLAEAQFKATGNSEAYAAEKTRILKEQMKQQQAAVEAAEKAIKDLTDQGMEPNNRIMQQWQIRLSNAKTNLSNMQTKLNAVEKEFGEQKTAVKDTKDETEKYNDEMGKVAQGVNLQNTITAIDNLKGHIENVVKKAAQAAKAIWQMGVDSAQWADTVATESAKMGIDPETYQSWQYASQQIDTNVSDIAKSWTDIEKKLKEAEDETIKVGIAGKEVSVQIAQSSQDYKDAVTDQTKAAKEAAQATEDSSKTAADYKKVLKELGVSATDASGKVRTSNDIFWDAVDALHNITDATELEHKASQVFGNDWRNLQPLIQAGSKAYKDLAQEGIDIGAVLSNDQVAQLGGFDDAMQKVEAQSEALKNKLMAGLSPTFEEVANALSEANKALSDFLASEEGQAAIAGLNEALKGIIDSFLGEDNGQGTFQKIVEGASGAVEEFTKLLEWISNNGDAVKAILLGIAGTWGRLTVFKEALLVMQLIQGMGSSRFGRFLMNMGGGGAGTGGAGASSASSGATAAVSGGGVGLGPALALTGATKLFLGGSVSQWNENAEAKANAQAAGDAVVAEVERTTDIVAEKLGQETAALRDEMVRKATEAMVPVMDTSMGYVPGLGTTVAPMTENRSALVQTIEYMKQNADTIQKLLSPETYQQIMNANPNGTIFGIGSMGNADLLALVRKATDEMTEAGRGAGDGLVGGMTEKEGEVQTAAQGLADAGTDTVKNAWDEHSPSRVFSDLGAMASVGLANGINARAGEALTAAQNLAEQVTAIMREALQIHSPSRVFEQMGEFTGAGFALGIERSIVDVNRAAGRMVGAVSGAARITPAGYSGGGWSVSSPAGRAGLSGAAGAFPEKVQVTVMVDKDVLAETTVPLVDAKMGARLNAVRR